MNKAIYSYQNTDSTTNTNKCKRKSVYKNIIFGIFIGAITFQVLRGKFSKKLEKTV